MDLEKGGTTGVSSQNENLKIDINQLLISIEKNPSVEDYQLKLGQIQLLNSLRAPHANLPKNVDEYLAKCRKGIPKRNSDSDIFLSIFAAVFNPNSLNQLLKLDDDFLQRKLLNIDNRAVTLTMYVLHTDIDVIFYKMFQILFGKINLDDFIIFLNDDLNNNNISNNNNNNNNNDEKLNLKQFQKCTHKEECKHCEFLIRIQEKKISQIKQMFTYVMNHIIVDKENDQNNLLMLRNIHNPNVYGLILSEEKKQQIQKNKISSTILRLMAQSESFFPEMFALLEKFCPYVMKNIRNIQKVKQNQQQQRQNQQYQQQQLLKQKQKHASLSVIRSPTVKFSPSVFVDVMKSPVNDTHDENKDVLFLKKRKQKP